MQIYDLINIKDKYNKIINQSFENSVMINNLFNNIKYVKILRGFTMKFQN